MLKFFTIGFIFLFMMNSLFAGPAVTYGFSGGRFGDNLTSYLHAKWIAFYYKIPLVYIPFAYSSELMMDEKESSEPQFIGFNKFLMTDFSQPSFDISSTLYVCPYFWELDQEINNLPSFYFKVDWKNKEYRRIVREMISLKRTLQLVHPPEEMVSIAIHVREGGGFDDPKYPLYDPPKCPPIHFYIDSLLQVLELLKGKQIYCHIFTDAREPKVILDTIQQMIPSDTRIIFTCRENNNCHNANVLEDFFSLFNFDILIRPQSNFSIVPSLIHDYAIICCPISYSIDNQIVKIEEIKISIDDELYTKCLNRNEKIL